MNVLWGARRGDRVLAVRTAESLHRDGMPAWTLCHAVDHLRQLWWLWVPRG